MRPTRAPEFGFFSVHEARAVVPELQRLTEYYAKRVSELSAAVETATHRDRLSALARELMREWRQDVRALGGQALEPWVVALDNGDGIAYIWRHPEDDLVGYIPSGQAMSKLQPIERLGGPSH